MSLLKTAARAAVASSVHGRVQRRQQERWAAQPVAQAPVQQVPVQQAPVQQAPVQQAPVQQAAQPAADPRTELMNSLTALRSAGVVSDAEFADISSRIFA
ncbi:MULTISPECIES: hypothetical protein [unclassified Gordonia (in: high G+C Gram-positive bacteria)]